MNNSKVIDTDIIRDIVLNSQEAVSDALASMDNADEITFFENVRDELLAQFQNIGMIADMSGLKGLNDACVQYCMQISDLPLSNSPDTATASEKIKLWINNILIYLEDWQSFDNMEQLINGLTNAVNEVRIQLLRDIETINSATEISETKTDSEEKSFTINSDDFAIDSEALNQEIENDEILDFDLDDIDSMLAEDDDLSLDSPEGIMALLCHELVELQPKISELTQQLITGDDSEISTAAAAYQDIISRIHNTCDGLGLSGLVQVSGFISKNITLAIDLDAESKSRMSQVMQGWPKVIIDHLESPADDKLCLEVVDYLEHESWPEPLKYSEIRELIDGLTRQLELTGDYEVEARSVEAHTDDVSLDIAADASQQLMDAFFAESPGYAEELTRRIAEIVNNNDVKENTKAAQRISHSLKGSANLIACKGIANFAHHLEDIFEYLAKQSFPPPEPLAFTMQEAADTIEVMIESLQGLSFPPEDAQRILQDVLNWANRIDNGNLRREADIAAETSAAIVKIDDDLNVSIAQTSDIQDLETEEPETQIAESPVTATPSLTQTELVHVPRETIDLIFNLIGETSISIAQIQEQLNRMNERGNVVRSQEKTLQTRRFELENLVNIRGMAVKQKRQRAVAGNADFDSLEMDQYNEFYGATHSFIESVSDTREASRDVTANLMELEDLFQQQIRLNRALQDLVVTTRMVAVKTISARLQRAVRQASRATGKPAELILIGENLLMDGDVLSQLADPIMHMLRNAIDHGIESSTKRFEIGKPKAGQITLKFYLEGNTIRVTCSDDGAGLDYQRIRDLAIKRNLITAEEELDHSSLARLILNSGFSTREEATQISGRGVGMDVVHTSVMKLKGNMDIYDNEPCGTTFSIRLPITLLTSHSVLIKSGYERYAIPTSSLEQILPPGTGLFNTLDDELTFQLGEKVYVTRSLEQLLGVSSSCDYENRTVLLAHFDNEDYAITVESVISSYDLVVKGLGRYVNNVPGIAGVSLLGNGSVVPVLDVMQLIDIHIHGKQQIIRPVHKEMTEQNHLPRILIVDDSLSVRKSLSQLVQDAGYEPLLARDGVEALDVLQKSRPNLVLTDLEMPRMTGLELAKHIRSNPENDELPIMMITSRTMDKHKKQAQKAGINQYITKPFSEDDLIIKIGEALNG